MTAPHHPPDSGGSIVIGTAGHIDHGKSTLVRALTGTDPDRLPEERRRGITIDLGFAQLIEDQLSISFVDVPGHERFIHNMLAGATGIDGVLLVIAADEGVMPQTREHLAITQLLRVPLAAVALTRSDLIDDTLVELAREDTLRLLAEWRIAPPPIIPCSGISGAGLDQLRGALRDFHRQRVELARGAWPRLPIDRVFAAKGYGTIVTGTLQGGALQLGDALAAIPAGPVVRVRGLQLHGIAVERAPPHARVAVNLAGTARERLQRGLVLVPASQAVTARVLDVVLETWHEATAPLRDEQRVRIHHGTSEVLARVRLALPQLAPGERGAAQLRLEAPLAALPGDRFVVRRPSPVETLAGGEVVILDGPRWRKHDRSAADRASGLAGAGGAERLLAALERAGPRGLVLSQDATRLGSTPSAAIDDARAAPSVALLADEVALGAAGCETLAERLIALLRRAHRERPLEPGVPSESLRRQLTPGWSNEAFRALLNHFVQQHRVVMTPEAVALPEHSPLSGENAAALGRIAERLAEAGFQGMSEDEMADRCALGARAGELIILAHRAGIAVRLPGRLVIGQAAWHAVVDRLRAEAAAGRPVVGVAEFKQLFGLTRRVAIPLLERLDDQGVTQRIGDRRRVRNVPARVDDTPGR